ncbi:hypothetical protein AAFC00_004268 [Neodothiora populina]|uniref:Serine hydrolase domain-containing protein n=1 Tax=Neodothiora populina TaxID=2781224 RepID=A0ABR3PJ48_9PEZI
MKFEPFLVDEAASSFMRRKSSYLFSQRDLPEPNADASSAFRRGSVLAAEFGTPLRRASVLVAEQQHLVQEKRLHPLITEVDYFSESEPESPESPAGPVKILMLHGYTQSGDFFSAKTRRIREGIKQTIESDLREQYPEGVEFFYPDAPLLNASGIPGYEGVGEKNEDLRGWFDINDMSFRGLEESLRWVMEYMRGIGPIHGIVGFSQGAALAVMIASLLEARQNPARLSSISSQQVAMDLQPPQGPLKFVVSMSGFRGTSDHYLGFYNPIIATPGMCIIAELDTMISEDISLMLVGSMFAPEVIRHKGGHYVPTDKKTIAAIIDFIRERLTNEPRREDSIQGDNSHSHFRKIEY